MPWRTISGSEPRGQEITGVPQASASAKTMPNGSFHWIGTTMAARLAQQLVLLRVVDRRRHTRCRRGRSTARSLSRQ